MQAPTGFDPQRLFAMMPGHGGRLGIELRDHGPDWCEMALPHRADLAGDSWSSVLASGAVLTLLDMAASVAIWVKRGRFVPQATLDLRVDYLRPVTPGQSVIGRAECYRLTHTVGFVRGQAHDGDPADPLAHVTGTFMFTGALADAHPR